MAVLVAYSEQCGQPLGLHDFQPGVEVPPCQAAHMLLGDKTTTTERLRKWNPVEKKDTRIL